MLTEKECREIKNAEPSWKDRKMLNWIHKYGGCAVRWNAMTLTGPDPRRDYVEYYREVYNALSELPETPCEFIRDAIRSKIEEVEEFMDTVLRRWDDTTYYDSEFEGETSRINCGGMSKPQFFGKVGAAISMSDCTEERIKEISFRGKKYRYIGWQPDMEFTFENLKDEDDTYTVWLPQYEH